MRATAASSPETSTPTKTEESEDDGDEGDLVSWKQTNKQARRIVVRRQMYTQQWPQLPLYFTGSGLKNTVGMKQDTPAGLLPGLSADHRETHFSEKCVQLQGGRIAGILAHVTESTRAAFLTCDPPSSLPACRVLPF